MKTNHFHKVDHEEHAFHVMWNKSTFEKNCSGAERGGHNFLVVSETT